MKSQYARQIIDVRQKTEVWFDNDGEKQSRLEIAIYTLGAVIQFPIKDKRLPPDIEGNFTQYRICKEQSGTRITKVWFERRQ